MAERSLDTDVWFIAAVVFKNVITEGSAIHGNASSVHRINDDTEFLQLTCLWRINTESAFHALKEKGACLLNAPHRGEGNRTSRYATFVYRPNQGAVPRWGLTKFTPDSEVFGQSRSDRCLIQASTVRLPSIGVQIRDRSWSLRVLSGVCPANE